jgi:hypothetical protein
MQPEHSGPAGWWVQMDARLNRARSDLEQLIGAGHPKADELRPALAAADPVIVRRGPIQRIRNWWNGGAVFEALIRLHRVEELLLLHAPDAEVRARLARVRSDVQAHVSDRQLRDYYVGVLARLLEGPAQDSAVADAPIRLDLDAVVPVPEDARREPPSTPTEDVE